MDKKHIIEVVIEQRPVKIWTDSIREVLIELSKIENPDKYTVFAKEYKEEVERLREQLVALKKEKLGQEVESEKRVSVAETRQPGGGDRVVGGQYQPRKVFQNDEELTTLDITPRDMTMDVWNKMSEDEKEKWMKKYNM